MNGKKNVLLIPENHVFLKKLAFINGSTIEFETNQIISNKRKKEEINIYVAKQE